MLNNSIPTYRRHTKPGQAVLTSPNAKQSRILHALNLEIPERLSPDRLL